MKNELEKGLYSPEYEKDACGVGLVVNINGSKYHDIIEKGLAVLENMAHRGAEGADSKTGDGAGIMVQIPHEFILLGKRTLRRRNDIPAERAAGQCPFH